MGTRYIINALRSEFIAVMERAVRENATVDVTNCKFGPICAHALRDYYAKINIIDSGNPKLNALLQSNIEATKTLADLKPYPDLDFSTVDNFQDIVNILGKLKPGDKYHPVGIRNQKQLASLVYCIMTNPEVDFDVTEYLIRIYDFVESEWKSGMQHHDKYILLLQPDYRIVDVVDGHVDCPESGKTTESNFVMMLRALPYEFGTQNIVEVNSKGNPVGEWAGVVNKILTTLGRTKWKQDSILTRLEFAK